MSKTKIPNLFLVASYALFLILGVMIFPEYSLAMFYAGTINLGSQNVIFPLTYGMALFTVIFSFVRFHAKHGILKTVFLSITTPFAFVASFELVWANTFLITGGYRFLALYYSIMAIWFLFGLSTMFYWRISTKFWATLLILIAVYTIWVVSGFHQIQSTGITYVEAVGLNLITKFLFGLIFIVLIYDGTKAHELGNVLKDRKDKPEKPRVPRYNT
jgi:hypothetical protein